MLLHQRQPSSAEVSIITSTIKIYILHKGQAFLPISFNYWTSTLFWEDLPVDAFTPRCLNSKQSGGISAIKRSSFYWKLRVSYTSERTGLKTKPRALLSIWAGPELTSWINEVQNTVAGRSDRFTVRFPRQSFLSCMYQLLFTAQARKTWREHVRTRDCIFPSSL